MHSSIFLEAKNEEKLKQKFSFFFHQVKIKFAHFGGLQNSNYIFHVKFYSYRLFFEKNVIATSTNKFPLSNTDDPRKIKERKKNIAGTGSAGELVNRYLNEH